MGRAAGRGGVYAFRPSFPGAPAARAVLRPRVAVRFLLDFVCCAGNRDHAALRASAFRPVRRGSLCARRRSISVSAHLVEAAGARPPDPGMRRLGRQSRRRSCHDRWQGDAFPVLPGPPQRLRSCSGAEHFSFFLKPCSALGPCFESTTPCVTLRSSSRLHPPPSSSVPSSSSPSSSSSASPSSSLLRPSSSSRSCARFVAPHGGSSEGPPWLRLHGGPASCQPPPARSVAP